MAGEATVDLSCEPKGPDFRISSDCVMPEVTVIANVKGIPAEISAQLNYAWSWKLEFDGNNHRVHSPRLKTHHDAPMPQVSRLNRFKLPFKQIRGGSLTVSVRVTGGKVDLAATTVNLRVLGTNPSLAQLAARAPAAARFRKMLRAESAGHHVPRQFLDTGFPLMNEQRHKKGGALTTDGGVGLCQITKSPYPTPDDIWSWKANLASAETKWKKDLIECRQIPKRFRASRIWADMVRLYNESEAARLPGGEQTATMGRMAGTARLGTDMAELWRVKSSSLVPASPLHAIEIDLPDFSNDEVEQEALRLYNGRVLKTAYEHWPRVDPRTGVLIVTRVPGTNRAVAEWKQVSKAERIIRYQNAHVSKGRWGCPDYVNQVERQPGF